MLVNITVLVDLFYLSLTFYPLLRAKIEKQYADEMIRLARATSGRDEIGLVFCVFVCEYVWLPSKLF